MTTFAATAARASLMLALAVLPSCGDGDDPQRDRREMERALARYLDAVEGKDATAALESVNPKTRGDAADDVAGVIARLGGRDLDAAAVTFEQSVSPKFALATVTAAGAQPERIDLARDGDDWYVALGSASSDRTPSTATP